MAYICYFACDRCGKEGGAWINRTVSLTTSIAIARDYGWKVGRRGWICPSCQNGKKKDRKNEIV